MQSPKRLLFPLFLTAAMSGCATEDDGAPDDDTLSSATSELHGSFYTGHGAASCSIPYSVSAAPGEEGQWAAVRVGAPAADFRPTKLTYHFRGKSGANGSWCAGNAGPHRVRVFAGPVVPPETPTLLAEVTVAAAPITPETDRTIEVPLRSAIVPAGKQIFVAVEMVGNPATDSGYNCLAGCGQLSRSTNWWSLETSAPYDWVPLTSLGSFPFDIGMRVEGDYP